MPHAELDGDLVVVETRWTEKTQIEGVPGARWDPNRRSWTVPLTWGGCVTLRGVFGDALTVGEKLAYWSHDEVRDRVAPAVALRERITRTEGPWDERLRDFQTSGSAFLRAAGEGALLGDDLGMGKTAQILAVLDALATTDPADALPALVICPNNVKLGWEGQVEMWKTQVVPYVISGSAAQRRKMIEQARGDPRALLIVNIESVRLLARLAPYGSVRLQRCRECDPKHGEEKITAARCEVHPKPLNGFGFRTVILDEAHAIKDPRSKQTRACWSVGHDPSVRRRWALTGTPVANHVGDLWSIMHFLVPREFPVKGKFVDRYALQAWNVYGGLDIVGVNPERSKELFTFLDPRFRRTPKALVLDQLPEVVRSVRWVEMSPKQAAAYRAFAKENVALLDDDSVLVAPNNLVAATRLLQLASSYAEVTEVKVPLTVHAKCRCYARGLDEHQPLCPRGKKLLVKLVEPSSKLDALEVDVESLGGKRALVAAQSRQLIELAAKRFDRHKVPYGLITGAVASVYERRDVVRRFQRQEIQLVLMTIGAGAEGTDGLQCADTLMCLQRSWSMLKNVQLDGRVHRFGSDVHDSVHVIDYVTRGTTESDVLFPRLSDKWEQLEEINRDRVRLAAAGLKSDQMFDLDRRESLIVNSFLNVPDGYAQDTTDLDEDDL